LLSHLWSLSTGQVCTVGIAWINQGAVDSRLGWDAVDVLAVRQLNQLRGSAVLGLGAHELCKRHPNQRRSNNNGCKQSEDEFFLHILFHLNQYYRLRMVWILTETKLKRCFETVFLWKNWFLVAVILKSSPDGSNLDIT
jgi:hypothetical protein